jgi:hypothetical protein
MFVLGVLQVIIGSGALASDSVPSRAPRPDTIAAVAPSIALRGIPHLEIPTDPADTVRKRRKAVEVSEWYSRRLTVHRYVAYATIPVFAVQYAAGERLFKKGDGAPEWAKTMHRVGATTLAGMFTVNTVTGAWNWWDSRSVSQGRVLRTVHALTLLGADAAFAYTGAKLSNEAENSLDKRKQHRTVALVSIGVTVASGLAMKLWNH